MKKYRIEISPEAEDDIDALSDVIMYEYKSYETAIQYIDGCSML